ncbi:hypothetical protein Gpo141_00011838 [Globisporangium polare]
MQRVERVWTEEQDGAWAAGKASVQLLTALLQHVQDDDVPQAELTARAILEVEPENQLVKDLLSALKQREIMEAELESESESGSEEEESEDESESEGQDEEEDGDETSPQGSEAKNNEEKG